MLFKKVLEEKKNNRGMSLVEVVCAVAIFGLTATLVSTAMTSSMQSYNRGIQETDLQKEAQMFANQISELVIDSTADVSFDASTKTLTIEQTNDAGASIKHKIYLDADGKVWYCDANDASGETQLLAEGVASIDFDLTNFSRTGNLGVKLALKSADNNRDYNANYTVTSRNGRGEDTSVPVAAVIDVEKDIIIEPGQTLTVATSVSGVTDTRLKFYIVSGAESGTTINPTTGEITCSPNQVSNFVVGVETYEKDGMGNPKAKVDDIVMSMRRVTGITLNHSNVTAGNTVKAGAQYQLDAILAGTNFLERDSQYDRDPYKFVEPDYVNWKISAPEGLVTLAVSPTDNHKAFLTLNRDMATGESITVTSYSRHSKGGTAGRDNKSGNYYADVEQSFTINGPSNLGTPMDYDDGILRGDQRDLVTLDQAELLRLKQTLGKGDGSVNWKFYYKFQAMEAGTAATDWILNSDGNGADGNDSMAYKLRPEVLYCMDRNYSYHFWMLVCMHDNATGERLYPPAGANLDSYAWQGDMKKFGIGFSSNIFQNFTNVISNQDNVPKLSGSDGNEVELFHYSFVRGWYTLDSEGKEFARNLTYTLQKKTADGWQNVANNGGMRHNGGSEAGCLVRPNNLERGSYRVLIGFSKIRHNTLDQATGLPKEGWDYDVPLYD